MRQGLAFSLIGPIGPVEDSSLCDSRSGSQRNRERRRKAQGRGLCSWVLRGNHADHSPDSRENLQKAEPLRDSPATVTNSVWIPFQKPTSQKR